MAGAETFTCPECGGPLTADGKSLTVICPHCQASVIVPEALRPKPAAPLPLSEPFARYAPPAVARRRSPVSMGCFLVAAVLLGLGVLSAVLQLGSDSSNGSTSKGVGLVATPTVPAFQRPLNVSLPRQVNYAGLRFTLTKGVIDNQDTRDDQTFNRKDQAFARLSFTLQNLSREDIFLDPGFFKLHLADGQDYALDAHTILSKDFKAPGPQSTGATTLIFPVPTGADWAGATLTIRSPQGEPAVIPLSGDMPPAAYPAQVSLPANPQATVQGFTYQILSATLDLDSGAKRADQGQRFLKLELQISNIAHQYGGNISGSSFRLLVNGVPSEPVTAPIQVVDYNAATQGEVVFQIPAQAQNAVLQLGDVTTSSKDFGKITLDLTRTTPLPAATP